MNGAITLLWSAIPELRRNIPKTIEIFQKTALHQTSTDCDSNGGSPNNGISIKGILLIIISFWIWNYKRAQSIQTCKANVREKLNVYINCKNKRSFPY